MRLKRLTLIGFKSFADKTEIEFPSGITAIVGPNGCGKSNIADAIRWVLGEQSAKALRGEGMADVIFNGTETRRAHSMAEVSLTIHDIQPGELHTAGVRIEHDELTITRRVYRDGHGEYFINRIPCRLRDIQLLFAGTGVGRPAYSILAQGNITQVLSSRPEDRRMVFEEAAGITRFKTQKREALRKLEYTEQNLLRLQDLIQEVERRYGSLQRQAAKARRYRRLAAQLRLLEGLVYGEKSRRLRDELAQLEQALDLTRQKLHQSMQQLAELEQQRTRVRARLDEHRKWFEQLQAERIRTEEEIRRLEQRVELLRARMEDQQAQAQRLEQEVERFRRERIQLTGELDRAREEHEQAVQELEQLEAENRACEEETRRVAQELQQTRSELSRLQNTLFDLARRIAEQRNRLSAAEAEMRSLLMQRRRLEREAEMMKVRVGEERHKVDQIQAELTQLETACRNLQDQLRLVEAEVERCQHERLRLAQIRSSQHQLEQELQARIRTLEREITERTGISEHARYVLERYADRVAPLSEKLPVDDQELLPLVTQLLGPLIDALIIRDGATLQQIARETTRAGSEQVAMIVDQRPRPDPFTLMTEAQAAAALEAVPHQPILSRLAVDVQLRRLLAPILGHVYLVPDLETAWKAWELTGGWFSFVTSRGELLLREGICLVGQQGGSSYGQLLQRRVELEQARKRLESIYCEREETERQLSRVEAQLEQLKEDLRTRRQELAENESERSERRAALQSAGRMAQVALERYEAIMLELENLQEQEKVYQRRAAELRDQVAALQKEEEAVRAAVEVCRSKLLTLEKQYEELSKKRSQILSRVAAGREGVEGKRRRVLALQRRLSELDRFIAERSSWLEKARVGQAEIDSQIREASEGLRSYKQRLEQLTEAERRGTYELHDLERELHSVEQRLEHGRGEADRVREQRQQIELQISEHRLSLENLRARFEEKHGMKLDQIESGREPELLLHDEPEQIREELIRWYEEIIQWPAEKREEEIHSVQKRLSQMGEVNLVAIQEFEETEQRLRFLKEQLQDLTEAKRQLIDLINRINTETRSMFLQTFQEIRRCFQTLFSEIFGGGRADLILQDEAEVLECGIDIVARPPGKQLQSISLLSGGEQTMTAVALLFAIYMVRPSPFCVLDELDAPLDDANIDRFIRIVRRFLDRTQFIIITHNKRTIAMADAVFGVTMEERGVSKVYSIRLSGKEEGAGTDRSGVVAGFPSA